MDAEVLRALAKWPGVPDVYDWLSLSRRGDWLLRGEKISHPGFIEYIGRNYTADKSGAWFFQNGPQRVFAKLDYTPFVYRLRDAQPKPRFETHTGLPVENLTGAWLDETGSLLLQTEYGIGVVLDRHLNEIANYLCDEHGNPLADFLSDPAFFDPGNQRLCIERLHSTEVAARFGFITEPQQQM